MLCGVSCAIQSISRSSLYNLQLIGKQPREHFISYTSPIFSI